MKEATLKRLHTVCFQLSLTLEQCVFELNGSTYMQTFFNKYIVQYNTIQHSLNPKMGNGRYGGLSVKLHMNFQLCRRSALRTPVLFKGQLYMTSVNASDY